MKEAPGDNARLHHILDAIKEIESYTKGIKKYETFVSNSMMREAVTRQLEIIGEASANISEECKRTL